MCFCGKGASRWERKDGAFVNLGCGGEGGDCEVIFNVWCVVERKRGQFLRFKYRLEKEIYNFLYIDIGWSIV